MPSSKVKNRASKSFLEKLCFMLGYFVIRALYASCRFEHHGSDRRERAKAFHDRGGYLVSCWHEHVIMAVMSQKGYEFHPIVSESSAGQFVGYVCERFGYQPIVGSQSRNGKDKGGARALLRLLKRIKRGAPVALTVDGSVGPRRVPKPGAIELSRKTGAGILPLVCVADRYWELNTWDRLKVPKPFSRIIVQFGEPVAMDENMPTDEYDEDIGVLTAAINSTEEQALAKLS